MSPRASIASCRARLSPSSWFPRSPRHFTSPWHASARVAASISDTGGFDADRELVGQGLASVASAFFGGMPATGAIARTAVNVRTCGNARLAAIVHALVLLAIVYGASGVVSQIPLAALAGVLMVTASRMISVATVRSVIGSTGSDAVVFVLTAIITVSFDLIVAVGIGIAAAGIFALVTLARSGGVHREPLPAPAEAGDEHIALFRLEGALFFGAADRMLDEIIRTEDVSVVICGCRNSRSSMPRAPASSPR